MAAKTVDRGGCAPGGSGRIEMAGDIGTIAVTVTRLGGAVVVGSGAIVGRNVDIYFVIDMFFVSGRMAKHVAVAWVECDATVGMAANAALVRGTGIDDSILEMLCVTAGGQRSSQAEAAMNDLVAVTGAALAAGGSTPGR